ncbi:MAG: hypothetical protein Kow00128_05720 [Deltaproteobacteria bacterium]
MWYAIPGKTHGIAISGAGQSYHLAGAAEEPCETEAQVTGTEAAQEPGGDKRAEALSRSGGDTLDPGCG